MGDVKKALHPHIPLDEHKGSFLFWKRPLIRLCGLFLPLYSFPLNGRFYLILTEPSHIISLKIGQPL
jgi:hypothetical protein